MNWCDIIKKNDKPIETQDKLETEIEIDIDENIEEENLNLKNVDEEFNKEYSSNILDIKFEFRDYIEKEYLPFLNVMNKTTTKYNFYDFIKQNSVNYKKLMERIEKENEAYLKQLEEEENKYLEEDINEFD
jgi:hypothetical protein